MTPIQQMFLGLGAASKTYVDEVFSTQAYIGNDSSITVTNNIDNSTEGGMVWLKSRSQAYDSFIFDTVRGVSNPISSNTTGAQQSSITGVSAFNTTGYTIGNSGYTNGNGIDYVGWNFRKTKGFFDIVTYTQSGSDGSARTIDHNLGCVPAFIMLKQTTGTESWVCYHRDLAAYSMLTLNSSNTPGGDANSAIYNVTSTQFTVGSDNNRVGTYVAYIFAGGESTGTGANSVKFDNNIDALEIASDSDLSPGSGDFTWEAWIKPDDTPTYNPFWLVGTYNGGGIEINKNRMKAAGGSNYLYWTTFPQGQWTHLAVCRSGSTARAFVNGTQVSSATCNENFSTGTAYIGYTGDNVDQTYDGSISNLRFVKGQALYTSSFRPPYEPLTTTSQGATASNVKLLCCNDASSATGSTVTPSTISQYSAKGGTATASTDSPFDDPDGFKFGEEGDQNLIKMGSYVGNSTANHEIYLGWEPQWWLVKNVTGAQNWQLLDTMRGWIVDDNDEYLVPNNDTAEGTFNFGNPTPTGFNLSNASSNWQNESGSTYVYIAIRRPDGYVGKPADAGTDVFAMDTGNSSATGPAFDANFAVDFALNREFAGGDSWATTSRLTGRKYVKTNSNESQQSAHAYYYDDYNNGWAKSMPSNYQSWMWKRGQGMDVVTYTGNGVSGLSIAHSMNAAPEMMIIKRTDATQGWLVYHMGLNGAEGNTYEYGINLSDSAEWQESSTDEAWGGADPTSTHFTVGELSTNNTNGAEYISFLFSSVTGISKVGVYAGSNSAQSITTGFQPRFVIIKNTANTDDWYVLDTTRGWAAGDDKRIYLNQSSAQSDQDVGAPTSTGFDLTANVRAFNQAGRYYIYYAHA